LTFGSKGKKMKKVILSVMVGAVFLLFTGCADNPRPIKVNLGLKRSAMKIYVDNTLDKDKQKRVRDAMVYAISKMLKKDQFKLVKTKGYIGEGAWDLIDLRNDKYISYDGKYLSSISVDRNVNVYEFDYFHYVNLYNFMFDRKHKLTGDSFDSVEYYKRKPQYTLKKIGDTAFEVKGFKTPKEAIDIYLQILRFANEDETFGHSNFKDYIREYMKEKTDVGVDWTTGLYYGNMVRYDPYELAVNKRLILKPTILEASKKYQLKSLLDTYGYTVVNEPKDANIIISIQNLAFGEARRVNFDKKIITNRLKNKRFETINPNVAGEYGMATTNFASMHTSAGNAMSGVSAALGVLSLFDSSEYNTISLDFVSIFAKGKNVYNGIVSPKIYTIKQLQSNFKYGIGIRVSMLNYASALEILKILKRGTLQ